MKQILLLLTSLFFCDGVYAQVNPAIELLGPDCMEAGSASIKVYDMDKNEEVYSFDPHRALPTASIQKLMTTAAVLRQRGADFRYKTLIGYTGSVTEGRLNGDVVIVGSGDPTLGSGYFEDTWELDQVKDSLLNYLSELRVKEISGDIIVDVSTAPGQHVPGGWPWSDLGNYYGAGHWALNIHDNEYKIFFRQNQTPGLLTSVLRTSPEVAPFQLTNEVRTGLPGSGDQAYIYSAPYSEGASIRGTIPPGQGSFSIRGSLTNPPVFFGQQIAFGLEQSQIQVKGSVRSSVNSVKNLKILFAIPSPRLVDIVQVTNFRSVNLYAEGLLKLLCGATQPASQFKCGLRSLKEFWTNQGLDGDQFFFRDGSGLSPRNTASAQTFVDALKAIYIDKSWYNPFVNTMAEMGKEGTLRYMLRGYNGSGTINAKSGYIGRQRSYAGYMTTESGRNLVFCVMLDNYGCSSTRMRQRIERFLIGFLRE